MAIITRASLALITIAAALPAFADQKVGVVQMQSAIVGTQEGQKAASSLEAKMAPIRKDLETKQLELRNLEQKMQGAPAGADNASLTREIESKNKVYQRTLEDAKAQFQGEQERLLNDLGGKLMTVLTKYAKDKGFALVIDVSNPQTPVMFASETIDITKDLVDLYNRNSGPAAAPGKPATPMAAPANKPSSPPGK